MKDTSTLAFLKDKLKQNQIKLTAPRMAILDVLTQNSSQLDAEEIYMLARSKDSTISLATVYRNLKLLTDLGLLNRASEQGGSSVYALPGRLGSGTAQEHKKTETKSKRGRSQKDLYRIENQLNEALRDLNKIKLEKEIALEDVIKDFTRLDKILQSYEFEQNNLIQILLDIQEQYRWLPKHALLYVSSKMDIPLSRVYGIASFYKFLNLEPQGKHSILVCTGTACHVRGSMNLLQNIVDVLGVKPGDTTQDLKFSLDTVNCLGCCALGPVAMIDDEYYSNPSTQQLKKIFKNLD